MTPTNRQQAEHTPEPWEVFIPSDKDDTYGIDSIPDGTAVVYFGSDDMSGIQNPADAARIVTCVNALAGVSDPASALRAAREALEATQAANEALDAAHDPECWLFPMSDKQADAITAANIQSSEAEALRIKAISLLVKSTD